MQALHKLKRDLDFLLYEVLDLEDLFRRPRFQEHDRGSVGVVLETAQKIALERFANHNAQADAEEPQFDGEKVVLIPETQAAWDAVAGAGFIAASADEVWGGIQLPDVVARAATCYFSVANISSAGYPFLTVGAANLIASFATQEHKERYLEAMYQGRFSGTMALTEPAQGSALADISTTAYLQEDGSYHLKGQKIYISAGDHELSENIIHMVLAKIEGAPVGVKGISLFICPKYLVNDDGSIGERNDVSLAGLLHKMGYRNTSSTVLNFGEQGHCKAFLVGEPHQGLAYMFQMMNEARIGVGLGAASLGYAGYVYALDYARERHQGRLPSNKDPESPQVAIIEHADVRRMLLAQKSYVEGSLALCFFASRLVDDEKTASDPVERQRAAQLLDFLTPIVKSWPSKYALRANELAIQVLGGAGYIREYPVEQYYSDNRLNAIHEGTEGIQALDLLGRKMTASRGALYQSFVTAVGQTLDEAERGTFARWALALREALALHQSVSQTLLVAMAKDPDLALANASEFLDFSGRIALAWLHLKLAHRAQEALADAALGKEQQDFYRGKIAAARYHFEWELPVTHSQATLLQSLNRAAFDMDKDFF